LKPRVEQGMVYFDAVRLVSRSLSFSAPAFQSTPCIPELQIPCHRSRPIRNKIVMKAANYAAPWMAPLKKALEAGGTKRKRKERREARRKHVQIATVDPSTGRPSIRTVSFRGFLTAGHISGDSTAHISGDTTAPDQESDEAPQQSPSPDALRPSTESCMLTFITDARAEKVRHLQSEDAYIECCWWIDDADVQFRIGGRPLLASHTSTDPKARALCEMVWDKLSASSRRVFAWPAPGEQKPSGFDGDPRDQPTGTSEVADLSENEGEEPPLEHEHFMVLAVLPDRVDELRLGGRQRRYLYSLNAQDSLIATDPLASPLWWTSDHWRVEEVNP